MDFLTALKVAGRHWLVVLIALVTTVPVARAVGDEVKPVYEAHGTLLLLSPSRTMGVDGRSVEVNPFTRLGNAERVIASTVVTVTFSKRWADHMRAEGATGKFQYRLASEVLIEVKVTDSTPTRTLDTLSVAIRLFEEELAQRQQRAGAPRETWIYSETIAVSDEATALLGSRIRATAGVGLLGLGVAISLAFLAEALKVGGRGRLRRRRKQLPPRPVTPDGPPSRRSSSRSGPAEDQPARKPASGRQETSTNRAKPDEERRAPASTTAVLTPRERGK